MSALSIPERAREIAHQMADSVAIPLWAHESCVRNFVIVIESAMRSERELCIKRIAEYKETLDWPQSATVENCIELLREGGQK